jgi:tetratricopeptide (TPR) repeat protein
MSDPKSLMKQGEDALKLSWTKWEADHMAAGSLFEQAAKAYRAKNDGESAYGAYLKAAKSHLSKGGRGYEAAAAAYEQAGKAYPQKSAEMYAKSMEIWTSMGNTDQALDILEKTAENLERSGDLDAAMGLYSKAVDMVHLDEFTGGMATQRYWTILQTAFRKLVQGRRLAEAAKCGNKIIAVQKIRKTKSPKNVLQLIIVHLARGDIAAAKQLLNAELDDPEFFRSNEGEASQQLLEAWEKLNSDAIKKLVEGSPIKYLDAQVVYLARELEPLGKKSVDVKQSTGERPSEKPAATSQQAPKVAKVPAVAAVPVAAPTAAPQPTMEEDDLPDIR